MGGADQSLNTTDAVTFTGITITGDTINVGSAVLSANGTSLDLPAGTTIGGNVISGVDSVARATAQEASRLRNVNVPPPTPPRIPIVPNNIVIPTNR